MSSKSEPPPIIISSKMLGPEAIKRIEDFVEIQIKGKKNFHKILVIKDDDLISVDWHPTEQDMTNSDLTTARFDIEDRVYLKAEPAKTGIVKHIVGEMTLGVLWDGTGGIYSVFAQDLEKADT